MIQCNKSLLLIFNYMNNIIKAMVIYLCNALKYLNTFVI